MRRRGGGERTCGGGERVCGGGERTCGDGGKMCGGGGKRQARTLVEFVLDKAEENAVAVACPVTVAYARASVRQVGSSGEGRGLVAVLKKTGFGKTLCSIRGGGCSWSWPCNYPITTQHLSLSEEALRVLQQPAC